VVSVSSGIIWTNSRRDTRSSLHILTSNLASIIDVAFPHPTRPNPMAPKGQFLRNGMLGFRFLCTFIIISSAFIGIGRRRALFVSELEGGSGNQAEAELAGES